MTVDILHDMLSRYRFAIGTEEQLQIAIGAVLSQEGIAYEREVRISSKDRLDFLCESTAIETKIGGGLADVTRQLHRYAQSDRVHELLLVTTKNRHLDLPDTINEKPLRVLWIGGSHL